MPLRYAWKVNTFISVTTSKGERTRQRIVEHALELFEQRGYDETTLRDIADAAGISIGLAYRYFRRKEDLVLALYEQLSEEVARKLKLPQATVGERWAALERTRFKVLAPHRKTLLALVQAALDPDGALGVLSPATAAVRARWQELHLQVVTGASNPTAGEPLARLLYAVDLMLVLYWVQDRSTGARATRDAIDRLARLVDVAVVMPGMAGAVGELATMFQTLTNKERS
jgi:AcrR family transcriptional regulator